MQSRVLLLTFAIACGGDDEASGPVSATIRDDPDDLARDTMDTLFSLEITATDMLYVPAEVRIFVAIEGGIAGARGQFQDSDGDNMLGPGDTIIAHEEIAVWYEAEDAGQSHKVILRTDVAGEARRDLFTGSWAAE